MREAAKAAGARVVGSGREMPPVVVGRRSWKAVRRWPSERSWFGLMRRMVAMAVAAAACAFWSTRGVFRLLGLLV